MARRAGVLIPLFSIRTPQGWGLGEIPDLVPFAQWAKSTGFETVQLLPVNQPCGGQDSPYFALTAFALDPLYLALDRCPDFLATGGAFLLPPEDQALLGAVRESRIVRWGDVRALKMRALARAFASFLEKEWTPQSARAQQLKDFVSRNAGWLEDYALFVALHQEQGDKSRTDWPKELADHDPQALEQASTRLAGQRHFLHWLQWQLDEQWKAARDEVNGMGLKLMGDLPFVVAGDSADVWGRRGDFRLDARVGVPPDAFSADGQDWGLPVFRWDVMTKAGHPWFRARAERAASLFDSYRVDHVVGLYRTYFRTTSPKGTFTPSTVAAQTRNGETVLKILSEKAQVIAEDLGVVPPFVRTSLTGLGIPGYRVLRWEKDKELYRDPATYPALSVAVSGTHDTDSVADWYESLPPEELRALLAIPALQSLRAEAPTKYSDRVRDALLEALYSSGSDLALLPLQDLLGHRERVNTPATMSDANWSYRMPMALSDLVNDGATTARLAGMASRSGRKP